MVNDHSQEKGPGLRLTQVGSLWIWLVGLIGSIGYTNFALHPVVTNNQASLFKIQINQTTSNFHSSAAWVTSASSTLGFKQTIF